jgi:hypothetical protein
MGTPEPTPPGTPLPEEMLNYNIDEINTNIRILPYAGRTCCVFFSKCDNNSSTTIEILNSIKALDKSHKKSP